MRRLPYREDEVAKQEYLKHFERLKKRLWIRAAVTVVVGVVCYVALLCLFEYSDHKSEKHQEEFYKTQVELVFDGNERTLIKSDGNVVLFVSDFLGDAADNLDLLSSHGVDELSYLIISGDNPENCSAFSSIAEKVHIDYVIIPDKSENETYDKIDTEALSRGIKVLRSKNEMSFNISRMIFRFLDDNGSVLNVIRGDHSYIIADGLSSSQIETVIEFNRTREVDVLKIGRNDLSDEEIKTVAQKLNPVKIILTDNAVLADTLRADGFEVYDRSESQNIIAKNEGMEIIVDFENQ